MPELVTAAQVSGRLWSAMLPTFRLEVSRQQPLVMRGAFSRPYLESLTLPLDGTQDDNQTVALVDEKQFHRPGGGQAVEEAYQNKPRTRVYEGMDVRSDGWFSLAALNLARLARCRVVCSMYESKSGDGNLGAHSDEWLGVIVQMRGSKDWSIWTNDQLERSLLSVGDVLILPKGVQHDVSTPEYSAHLVFAFIAAEPLG